MKKTQSLPVTKTSSRLLYIFIGLLAGGVVYFAIAAYSEIIFGNDDHQLSFAAMLYFWAGIFIGQRLTKIVATKIKIVPDSPLIVVATLIVVIIIWLFIVAAFPLRNQVVLNLLLFGLPFIILSLAIGVFLELIRLTFQNQLQTANAQAEQSRSELSLLQSQLSPHFLFNTLNNMYGISITQHEKVPPLLLKLAELLRYSVYDAREWWVPLNSEIAYINNYIDFEKIRIGERLSLNTSIEEVPDPEKKIAPMLLIVFIENAFKHAKDTADQRIFVDINLKIWEQTILFSVKNSFSGKKEENSLPSKSSGLGLMNVTKRLQLLYPNEYDLKIESDESVYSVQLQLKIK